MTVFVVQKPKPGPRGNVYDISPAAEYGEIKFVFDSYDSPSAQPKQSYDYAYDYMEKNYNPDTDYIVAAGGDPYSAALISHVVASLGFPLRWLRFERYRKNVEGVGLVKTDNGYYLPVVSG